MKTLIKTAARTTWLLVLVVVPGACAREIESKENGKTLSFEARFTEAKAGPGDTTQATVEFRNSSSSPLTLVGLTGQATLVGGDGKRLPLHPISLGAEKPIVIAPGEVTKVPLLFDGTAKTPRMVILKDSELVLEP